MKHKDFAAFILTHGRPEKVYTYKTLRRQGYTGKIYLIIDDEDKARSEYVEKYGSEVIVFNKKMAARKTDRGDNKNNLNLVVFARNTCFEIANELGIKYFIQLDDDYTDFRYKRDDQLRYCDKTDIKSLDAVFDILLDYFIKIPAKSIAIAQGGDYIGGSASSYAENTELKRKAMNTFICSVERPFSFFGATNEDVNCYVVNGSRGDIFLTIPNLAINQVATQASSGGLTEAYLDQGTYVKSFYTVMMHPSSVKIGEIGTIYRRIHHRISWPNTVPVILNEKYRKNPVKTP